MVIDLERCVGCYACVVSCKQYFGTRPGIDYNQAKIAEWGAYPKTRRQYISLMCNHCEEPPCLISCPTGSTYKSPEGPVLTDPEKCDGCGTCVKACPYGQRFLSTKDETYFPGAPIPAEIESAARIGKAEKCTLCQERLKQGLEPICVALCPGGCRIFGDLADPESEINYYINLYGAVKIGGTSLYYVLPKGMDPALLPHGYDPEAGVLRETTAADAVGPRRTPEDPDYRQLMDGLIKARDWIRKNDDRKPDIGGEYKYTYCAQCSQMPRCGVKAVVKDGKVIRVERREEYGNELLCAIGNAAVQDLYAPDRLLHPMRRTNPKGEPAQWKRIGWDEAIREISEKLNGIKEKYGPEKVLFMTGDPKEPRSAMQRLAYTFGSPNFGTESSTCYTATELATRLIYGLECRATIQMRAGVADINETKVVLIWACNPAISGVPGYDRMKTAREYSNTKYIVIDPRATETVEQFADIHIPLRAGTDGALALFFANWLIARGAYDKAFVREWAHGFDEYRALAAGYTLERTARICGVPEALLEEAADTLVREGAPIAVRASSSVCQQTNGINTYRAIQLLVPLTGSLDVEGGHLAADEPLGLDMWGATYAFSRVHELLPKLKHLRVDTPYFPVWAGTDIDGSLQLNALPEYVKAGALRVCLMLGGNCMMWPQSHEYQEAFRDMEFVAAADLRIRPATHDYVDMVLPAAMSFERAAPFSVTGRKIFLREPIVPPAGEARSDYRICCDIGAALGYEKEFWGGGENAEEACLREILRTVGGANEVTLEMLRAASPDGVAARMKQGPRYKKYELGLLREDGQPGFETPSGKVEFASEVLRAYGFDATPVFREPTYSPVSRPELAAAYPLVMNAGSRVPFFCHSKERTLPWLRRFMPNPVVRVCRKDAEDRALREGDWVRVTSPVNPEGIVAKLEVTNIVRPGSIDMFHGWIEANVNELVPRDFDPISGFPPYREGLCQIEKSVKSEEEGQVPA
jgi:anaerobic selenocysteine-containing dehydrogenase/Fe-S-cluster-containing dehydrogenase component